MAHDSYKKLVVMGAPITHSRSPRIFAELFKRHGISNACYYQLHADGSVGIKALFEELGLFGANVTSPLKNIAFASVDSASSTAKTLRAVNTIIDRDGSLVGYNTDPEGVRLALQKLKIDPAGRRCIVLGAGGAAAAVIHTLTQLKGAPVVVNRTFAHASELACKLGAQAARIEDSMPLRGDLLFSCLPPGSALPQWNWNAFDWVFDSVYAGSPLEPVATHYSLPRIGGMEWLWGQAEAAFDIFFRNA